MGTIFFKKFFLKPFMLIFDLAITTPYDGRGRGYRHHRLINNLDY